ncbi:hypothetical protein THICB6_20095 [Thiomonas arsenitoxydans]|nr:hypothetical protein THICB6_20095 [Thiomonas arsenitoxydans]
MLEQRRAERFRAGAARAVVGRVQRQIGFDFRRAQRTESYFGGAVAHLYAAVWADDANRGVEHGVTPAESLQLSDRSRMGAGFAERFAPQHAHLIGTDHPAAWCSTRHRGGLFSRQPQRQIERGLMDSAGFVHLGCAA